MNYDLKYQASEIPRFSNTQEAHLQIAADQRKLNSVPTDILFERCVPGPKCEETCRKAKTTPLQDAQHPEVCMFACVIDAGLVFRQGPGPKNEVSK